MRDLIRTVRTSILYDLRVPEGAGLWEGSA